MLGTIMVGTSLLSMYGQSEAEKNAAKRQRDAIKANRAAAKLQFSAVEDASNLMKAINRENTTNAIVESMRVGSESNRETKASVQQAASTLVAQSEGLTSGNSKGRQMTSLYIKGNKVLNEVNNETTSIVNQLVDQKDAYTNEINNQLIGAHQEMAAILSNEGISTPSSVFNTINAGLQGASTGASLYSAFK